MSWWKRGSRTLSRLEFGCSCPRVVTGVRRSSQLTLVKGLAPALLAEASPQLQLHGSRGQKSKLLHISTAISRRIAISMLPSLHLDPGSGKAAFARHVINNIILGIKAQRHGEAHMPQCLERGSIYLEAFNSLHQQDSWLFPKNLRDYR
jgi:hypothetical protein